MSNYSNITGGLNITTQIPLDNKSYCKSEAILSDLGVDNNLAHTYYDGLQVFCYEEKTNWIWLEVLVGNENTGLITEDFQYPPNIIVFNIDYSNKKYNFFNVEKLLASTITNVGAGVQLFKDYSFTENDYKVRTLIMENTGIGNSVLKSLVQNNNEIVLSARKIKSSNGSLNISENQNDIDIREIAINNLPTSLPRVTDNILHEVSLVNNKCTIQELINLINLQIGAVQYEIKTLYVPQDYVDVNFHTSGLGRLKHEGWAICNGATHSGIVTPNLKGRVEIGHGLNDSVNYLLGQSLGSKDAVVVEHNHTYTTRQSNGRAQFSNSEREVTQYAETTLNTSTVGVSGINKNMQPYLVVLKIIKL